MKKSTFLRYLQNCFLLLVPILVWNIAFRNLLPEAFAFDTFWRDLPPLVFFGENFFRALVYIVPLFIPLKIYTKTQKIGLTVYLTGSFLYFLSWRPLILYPLSDWSTNMPGFLAPSVTPLIILIGIGLIGSRFVINIPYKRWAYILLSIGFTAFYTWHSIIVYNRIME